MAVRNLGRRYLVEISAADSRHAAFKYANGSVCFETRQRQQAAPVCRKSRFIFDTLHNDGSQMRLSCLGKHAKPFQSSEIFPRLSFLLFFFFPLPVLFGRRLPLAVSYCMLSRIITNLNMAHAASPRGMPLSSRAPNGTRMFCEPPSEKAGPLWCTPIRETEKMMCGNVHEGR